MYIRLNLSRYQTILIPTDHNLEPFFKRSDSYALKAGDIVKISAYVHPCYIPTRIFDCSYSGDPACSG
jgi:hypothetical protein